MTELIDPRRWDVAALAASYRAAMPFSHVVIDDFAEPAALPDLRAAFEDESAQNLQDEIFDVMASSADFEQLAFRRFGDRLRSEPVLRAVGEITSEPLRSAEVRAYAYLPGHYLLPHADRDDGGRRRVAFAFYVDLFGGLVGGELDLYACTMQGGEITETRVACTLSPRINRCVLFEVHERSLHRVREVTAGGRLSLAGWFVR